MEKYNKPPLSFDKQIELLASRGLVVSDCVKAEQFLSQVNYYRFSAYCLPFEIKRHQFHFGVTFKQIQKLYEFDRRLRFLIDEALEVIEISVRTAVSYWLHTFTYTRNICAHHSRIWNRQLSIAMEVPKKGDWRSVNAKRIGSVLFAINNLMGKLSIEEEIRLNWQAEINDLLNDPVDIPKFYEVMGLLKNWKDSLLWKEKDEEGKCG